MAADNFDPSIYSPFDVDMSNPDFDWIRFKTAKDKMSKKIQDLIFGIDTAIFLKEKIAMKFTLLPQQSAELARIVRDILIVELQIDKMIGEISLRLKIDKNIATQITNIIFYDLFIQAIDDINKVQFDKFKVPTINNQSPVPARNEMPNPQSLHEQNMGNVIDLRNNKK